MKTELLIHSLVVIGFLMNLCIPGEVVLGNPLEFSVPVGGKTPYNLIKRVGETYSNDWIAYVGTDYNVWIIHPDGTSNTQITIDGRENYQYTDLQWSLNGNYLSYLVSPIENEPFSDGPILIYRHIFFVYSL